MEHSVEAYLQRLPVEKIQVILEEWEKDANFLMGVSQEVIEILKRKVTENT